MMGGMSASLSPSMDRLRGMLQVFCSRYVNEHMLLHSVSTGHFLVLSYCDLSVWCYACEDYVHNEVSDYSFMQVLCMSAMSAAILFVTNVALACRSLTWLCMLLLSHFHIVHTRCVHVVCTLCSLPYS